MLNQQEMDEIVRVARKARAWLLVDEIYRGAEVSGPLTPTFWGSYDKVLITSGLSKAFGLPGPTAGMDCCTAEDHRQALFVPRLHHADADDVVRSTGADRDGTGAARAGRWSALGRLSAATCRGWSHGSIRMMIFSLTFRQWRGRSLSFTTSCRFRRAALFDRLRKERSVLITPGDHFGVGRYIRVGYGYDVDYTLRGLARVDLDSAGIDEEERQGENCAGEDGAPRGGLVFAGSSD